MSAQNNFYDLYTIQKIEVHFDQPNWDYQMDTAYTGTDSYIMAQWIKINEILFNNVGAKYKGNSSYDSTYLKNPVHISLNEFKEQSYQQFSDIKLGNNYADPSMIREVLSYDILKNYMDCPRSNFAQLYINDVYIGLYSNDESINKDFCALHFNSKKNTFIKCNPVINPGPSTKSNLKYLSTVDSTAYFNFYDIKSDYGWNDLVALCDSVTNHASTIENTFDMDKVLWMLAFNIVLVNLDSYSGVFCQNYYLYKDNSNLYNPIIWDLNMSFGGFPFLGNSNNSMGSLTIPNMQQLPLFIHETDPYWPLINAAMSNATYKKKYIAHIRTIINEMFTDSTYINTALQLQSLIDTSVQSDTNKFFSYAQFKFALDSSYSLGSYMVPGIQSLMSARVNYLQSTAELTVVPPVISDMTSDNNVNLNSSVIITAHVSNTNSNSVYLGYRLNAEDKFTKVLMYDDGLHNDGIANDNIYSAAVMMFSDKLEYYIYAENNDAGIFSPERAEHEFHSLLSNKTSDTEQIKLYPNPADDVINILPGRNAKMNFEIVNSLGEVVYQNAMGQSITTVETKNWTRGIYFLRSGSTAKKLVIMHP